jgi:hypothetical protein
MNPLYKYVLKHDMHGSYQLMAMDFPFRRINTLVSLGVIPIHTILCIIILLLQAVVVVLCYKLCYYILA